MTARAALHARVRERAADVLVLGATVEALETDADVVRVHLRADGLRSYRPDPADAFKLAVPTATGVVPRACTVAAVEPARGRIRFDLVRRRTGALAAWVAECVAGDHVELTGVRPEYAAAEGVRQLVLAGDASAAPAMHAIAAAADGAVHMVTGDLEAGLRTLALADVPSQVWIAGERTAVRAARVVALRDLGLAADTVHAASYWTRGLPWEAHFAASLRRFEAAREAGADVTDPGVLQRLDLDAG